MNAPDDKMLRKERESAYWDDIANQTFEGDQFRANIWKMEQIATRVIKIGHINADVLEVGIGMGLIAGMMNMLLLGKWRYRATDMSPVFVAKAKKNFRLDVVRTDVTCLPGEDAKYTRVWCFDSLEHVHPDDRAAGYAEIARVLAQKGLLLINMPLSEDQFHDPEFDHPFGFLDFEMIKAAGFRLQSYEAYKALNPEKARPSAFVVFERK